MEEQEKEGLVPAHPVRLVRERLDTSSPSAGY